MARKHLGLSTPPSLLQRPAQVIERGAAGLVPSLRRRPLTKMLVALVAGSVCGALWMILVDIVANTISIDTVSESVVLLVGVLATLVAALFLSAPESLSKEAGLSMIVIGFHGLALPIAALISFLE